MSPRSGWRVEPQASVRAFVERPGEVGAGHEANYLTGLGGHVVDHLRRGVVRAESHGRAPPGEHLVPREDGAGLVVRATFKATGAGDVNGDRGGAGDVTGSGETQVDRP